MNSEIQDLKSQLKKVSELENKVLVMSGELERLTKKLKNKDIELLTLVANQELLEKENQRIPILETQVFNLESKCALLASEIERQRNSIANKDKALQ